jgi:co-chaperonin GroES (HSP10)
MQLGSNEYLANAPRKEWEELEPEEHAKLLARQGQGYVTADLVRVVDVVVVRKYAGTEVKLDGEEHRIVDAEDILGVVEG